MFNCEISKHKLKERRSGLGKVTGPKLHGRIVAELQLVAESAYTLTHCLLLPDHTMYWKARISNKKIPWDLKQGERKHLRFFFLISTILCHSASLYVTKLAFNKNSVVFRELKCSFHICGIQVPLKQGWQFRTTGIGKASVKCNSFPTARD